MKEAKTLTIFSCSFALFNASTKSSRLRPDNAFSTSCRGISLCGDSTELLEYSADVESSSRPFDILTVLIDGEGLLLPLEEAIDIDETLREPGPLLLPGGAGLAMAAPGPLLAI